MSKIAREAVCEKINEYVQQKDITVAEFCRRHAFKQSSIASLLNGQTKSPSAHMLISLAKALDCSIDFLLGASDTNKGFSPGFGYLKQSGGDIAVWDECMKAARKTYEKYYSEVPAVDVHNFAMELHNYALSKADHEGVPVKFDKHYAKHRSEMIKAELEERYGS